MSSNNVKVTLPTFKDRRVLRGNIRFRPRVWV